MTHETRSALSKVPFPRYTLVTYVKLEHMQGGEVPQAPASHSKGSQRPCTVLLG